MFQLVITSGNAASKVNYVCVTLFRRNCGVMSQRYFVKVHATCKHVQRLDW